MFRRLLFTSVLVAGFSATVSAQNPDEAPARGVARISVINGDVSVRRGDSGDLIAAAINSPLVVQDRLITGPTARTEVQFDWANMIRLSHDAEVRFAELEYKRYIVQVARGTVTYRVLRDQDADVEVSTPSVSVRPVKKGAYRITVFEDGSSEITVRTGEAEIYTPTGSERLKSGRTMIARGSTSDPEFRFVSEINEDDWDRWNRNRDRDLERSRSYSYVSRDIYGAEDLDDHGYWVNVSSYGWVWSPRVAVGWAPYRHGRWSWVDYYGWSWVSYDPWGWAPYHYGRWLYSAPYGWCWWPGAVHSRHYWSPGLVAFFGFGSPGVGVGFGNIGWVPLAPYERYYPWYGRNYYGGYRSGAYGANSVRIVNNVNITNVYRNSRIDRAVTFVDHDGFSRGRSGGAARIRDAEFSRASVMQGPLPLTPGRESLRLADRDSNLRVAQSPGADRFFSHRQPAAVDRVPFEDQRRGVEQSARRTFGEQGARGMRTDAAPRSQAPADRAERAGGGGVSGVAGAQGIRTFDTPARSERAVGGSDRTSDNGWRRFGSPRVETPSSFDSRSDRAGQFGQPSAVSNRAERSADTENRGWRRIGEGDTTHNPVRAERSSERQSERAPDRSSGGSADWRRFGSRSETSGVDRSSSSPGRAERTFDEGWRRNISPRSERQEMPRSERQGQSSGGDAVRISPPIVRERSERQSFGGGGRSAPQMAPRSEGGGGSAPARSESGGGRGAGRDGGGGRSGGGGRGR
jgi:hypothetical protein